MKLSLALSVAGSVVALAACERQPLEPNPAVKSVSADRRVATDSSYVVVLQPNVADPTTVARDLVARLGGTVGHIYRNVFKGFSARLDARAAAAIRANPNVLSIELDKTFSLDTTETFNFIISNDPRWGLERIDQRGPVGLVTWTYSWYHNGAGVYAYIVDSGLDSTQSDFGGRGKNVYDVFGGSGQDCNGHGTHVAGTIGSTTYGVAKGVTLRGVRVFPCSGGSPESDIIAGLDWVLANHLNPAIVNMSLGGPQSDVLNAVVDTLTQAGIFVSVAAGNDAGDACNYSPSSAASAVTVAATTNSGSVLDMTKADYSNSGTCVDIYAPGTNIRSTKLGGGSTVLSGTSMAAPHVSGVAAIYISTYGDSLPSVIAQWLTNNATSGVVRGNPAGTPNLFVYKAPTL